MKVLVSAHACRPGWGSEPALGWQFVSAIAAQHRVWVLYDSSQRDDVEQAQAAGDLAAVTFVPVAEPTFHLPMMLLPYYLQAHYFRRQRYVAKLAKQLHGEHQFDLVHHLTYSSDWMSAGVLDLDVPSVWGPVGGFAPWVRPWTVKYLGLRGYVGEVIHDVVTGGFRQVHGRRCARRASLTIANNAEVADRLKRWAGDIVVHPHALTEEGLGAAAPDPTQQRALFLARMTPWKGLRLAIKAIAHPDSGTWHLDVVGDGPDFKPAERLARRLGVADRVTFHGRISLDEVKNFVASRDALLALGLHEGASNTVADAVLQGTPVVGLDRGGIRVLIEAGGGVLVPYTRNSARDIAQALTAVHGRLRPDHRWTTARLPAVLDELYERAIGNFRAAPAR